MNNILIRTCTLLLLMMFSIGVQADVKVLFGENGDDEFTGKGGTIEVKQAPDEKDETKVIVTLTVTPKKKYSISKDDIKVYATLPTSARATRGIEISSELKLEGDDPKDLSEKRDYTVTIDSKLGLWVRTAVFTNTRKGVVKTTSKFYFIANNASYNSSVTTNNYYFVPAADPHQANKQDAWYSSNYNASNGDPEKPFITTFKTDCDNNSIWEIISFYEEGDEGEDDEYLYSHLKHWATGKYLIYEPPHSNAINRKCVHLQTTTSPGENARFDIITNGTGVNIRPISLTSGNQYLNPASGNKDFYYGQGNSPYYGGMVGVWSEATANSIWHLDETIEPPSFTVNADGTVEILSATGTTIYYTTNGNNPTTSDGEYTGAITVTSDMTAIKAIAVRTSDSKTSNVVTLPLQTYTYHIVNCAGDIAVKCELKQAVGKTLSSYLDIPAAIQSPYLEGETASFYTFSEAYSSTDQLSDENQITETPEAAANIYVTYTTDHLSEKFLKLNGASAFNITADGKAIYDDSGSLASETADYSSAITTANHLWNFFGEDPYAVQIQNFDTNNFLVFSTPSTLSVAATATNNFILMEESAAVNDAYELVSLMAATGTGTPDYTTKAVSAYPVSSSVTYHLIDKAGKLIVSVPSTSSELALPDEWVSPLVSEYQYYKGATLSGDAVGSSCDFTGATTITSPFDVGSGGNIYVTYTVSDAIDITGGKTYMLKFSDGVSFYQEDGSDGIISDSYKAVYPYNNGEFHLYVYGQEQWEAQLAKGASTRTRWLWHIISNHNKTDLTGTDIDPYHVIFKSEQNQTVKDLIVGETNSMNYPGNTYLRTYKPDGGSVVTDVSYKSQDYHDAYREKMPNVWVNVEPDREATEYMILGTSMLNMKLKTFDEIDGSRQTVTSFEQYWKNNPTANNLLVAGGIAKVTGNEESISLTTAQRTFLESANATLHKDAWHSYDVWAYTKPWEQFSNGSKDKALKEGEHWFQTISMGSGNFTLEEVSLVPQVILLDQHGWEIMRVPLTDVATLRKYDSPMVEQYHWYPTADKVSGYHKYRVSNQEITVYDSERKATSGRFTHNSTTLAYTPYDYFETIKDENGWVTQDDRVKSDFYVTYTVKPEYANAYSGAAKENETEATPFLLKQGGNYAKTENGSTITTTNVAPARLEDAAENMQWNLRPNFNIDHEMGYKYAGETGAQDGALSKDATEADYMTNGQNGFDPYNVQIQSKAYPQRYFTTNTSGSALDGGTWTGTSSTVTLQNISNRQTATGYDQTTLNITNATFMVVNDGIVDGNGVAINMRLVPRFDNNHAVTFNASSQNVTLITPLSRTPVDNDATGTQTLQIDLISPPTVVHNRSEITSMNGNYLLDENFDFTDFTSLGTSSAPFTGTIDGQLNTLEGLTVPLVAYAENAIIKNVMLKDVTISQAGNVGAICNNAKGTTRIYNCGILPTRADNATNRSTIHSTNGNCGSLVGQLYDYARVINCFSFANVSAVPTDNRHVGGLVGYNPTCSNQQEAELKTMVMNCMFYGDITDGRVKRPVYGGTRIKNTNELTVNNVKADYGLNNYNYYCEEEASFDNEYTAITDYNCSWPVAKKYLTRFEVYRNLLNSNRRLCTWWVNGTYGTAPSDTEVKTVDIAKWVLDLSIAPYPILKEWGKYPSVINPDPDKRVDPSTKAWVDRDDASSHWGTHSEPDMDGQILGSITVNIDGGDNHTGTASRTINITAMDKEYKDYCYGKIQLPYYNEIFGNPNGSTWNEKYGDNYGEYVVTGWEITSVTADSRDRNSFTANWETGYNFADRNCTDKDLFGTSGRVFAQGGYYYVPDGVSVINIKAHWGKAVYLCNANRYLDRVGNAGTSFVSAGTLPDDIGNGKTIQTSLQNAVGQLTIQPTKTVYDQAIVLVGNYQDQSFHSYIKVSGSEYDSKAKPFTIMSADFDFDNEPDFCLQAGMKDGPRINTHPIRFDFLYLPDLTMAARASTDYYGMRIFCPQGHFEVTETSYMYITQFEYDMRPGTNNDYKIYMKHEAPMILNGGEFLQMVSAENLGNGYSQVGSGATATWYLDRTSYFLMGGNLYMKAFTPGTHGNRRLSTRHCAVNAIGGDYPEFYLSGMFNADFYNMTDNPHAYLDGGNFGIVAGAGMESVGGKDETTGGDVTFKINHSIIKEFYGGGINANRPVTGTISVTIDNSKVTKYCGGPKVGDMSSTKTITTSATGSTFDEFYGGGNGGTNNERRRIKDSNGAVAAPSYDGRVTAWTTDGYGFNNFSPLQFNNGYETEFEFELLPDTRGTSKVVKRTYSYWASFARTTVAPVTNIITDCTFNGNYYGGGNLGAVSGNVTSTLQGHTVVNGSVFGAGFSASIPTFQVHDPSTVEYPYRDFAGFIHDGSLKHKSIQYKWIHDVPAAWGKTPNTSTKKDLYFEDPDNSGDWYVYTTESLIGLGTVSGNATITIKGTTEVTGDVFGGGAQSAVTGNTIVTLLENVNVQGNVYGGGDQGVVQGTATVNLGTPPSNNNGSRASGGSGEGTGEESGEGIGK